MLCSESGAKAFRVKHKRTGRVYTRTVVNTEEWKGRSWTSTTPTTQSDDFDIEQLQVGDVIAVKEGIGELTFTIAEITEIGDQIKTFNYVQRFARGRQKKLKSLRVYEGWNDAAGVMVIPPKGSLVNCERHWGMYKLDSHCILAHRLSFLASGSRKKGYKLDAASVKKLCI